MILESVMAVHFNSYNFLTKSLKSSAKFFNLQRCKSSTRNIIISSSMYSFHNFLKLRSHEGQFSTAHGLGSNGEYRLTIKKPVYWKPERREVHNATAPARIIPANL